MCIRDSPTTDALEIIKNVLAMKSEYFIHEDYGMFGYEEQYIYGDISVNAVSYTHLMLIQII